MKTSEKLDHSNSVGMMVKRFVALVASLASAIENMRMNGTKKTAETMMSTA